MPLETSARGPKSVVFSEATFRGQLGSRFEFIGDKWRGPLQLKDVVAQRSDERVEQFTAIFKTAKKSGAAAGVYEVAHPELGRFTLRIDGQPESDRRVAAFALLRG
jgi:hypothetical protein